MPPSRSRPAPPTDLCRTRDDGPAAPAGPSRAPVTSAHMAAEEEALQTQVEAEAPHGDEPPSPRPVPHPIEERLEQLAALREQALHAGARRGGRAPAQAGQAHRSRAHRPAARSRLVRRARHARPPPGARVRHRGDPPAHRRRRHRLGHRRRPQGVPVQPGLHRVRRRARRGVRREDPQGDGPRRVGRRPDGRAQRRRRRPHPGGRRVARRLRRHLLPQREGVRGDPADQRDPRARAPAARCTRPRSPTSW